MFFFFLYRIRLFRIAVTGMSFLFLFFFLSLSIAVAAWSGIERVDPQMIHLELFFLSSGAQEPGQPQTIFV